MKRSTFLRRSVTLGSALAAPGLIAPLASGAADATVPAGFTSRRYAVNGIHLHAVTGGSGPALVLLAGWPETWYAWRLVMPALAEHFTVIAPDMRGQGDSDRPLTGYDTHTLAADVHALVEQLGHRTIHLAGHDVGAWAAFAYASVYRDEVQRVALLDAAIPGVTPPQAFMLQRNSKTWQFFFNAVPDVPEMLTAGREREYLSWFFRTKAARPDAISPATIDVYVKEYAEPGGMRAGFAYYRAVFDDIDQNTISKKTPLAMPVLALGGDHAVGDALRQAMTTAATDVSGGSIAACGHYIPEEAPRELIRRFNAFFGGG
jgi:pimeloyl-ACP methyl ester carboxylesterase